MDAWSGVAFTNFDVIVTFNTVYFTNKYDMSFGASIGVNHQGHLTLLGCGLISNEDTKAFVWLI